VHHAILHISFGDVNAILHGCSSTQPVGPILFCDTVYYIYNIGSSNQDCHGRIPMKAIITAIQIERKSLLGQLAKLDKILAQVPAPRMPSPSTRCLRPPRTRSQPPTALDSPRRLRPRRRRRRRPAATPHPPLKQGTSRIESRAKLPRLFHLGGVEKLPMAMVFRN
jgi:hypothetical protein